MVHSRFSPEEKYAIVIQAIDGGYETAAQEHGIALNTISNWRKQLAALDLVPPNPVKAAQDQMAVAREIRRMRVSEQRQELAANLIAFATIEARRLVERGNTMGARDKKDTVISIGVAIDKWRLETGADGGDHGRYAASRRKLSDLLNVAPERLEEIVAERLTLRRRDAVLPARVEAEVSVVIDEAEVVEIPDSGGGGL